MQIHRESNMIMIALVSLYLLNKLRKSIKMQGLQSIFFTFTMSNKFNNRRAQMLDFIYHMTLKSK